MTTKKNKGPGTATLYRAKKGFRWSVVDDDNGKIIGASTEDYTRRIDCKANFNRMTEWNAPGFTLVGFD